MLFISLPLYLTGVRSRVLLFKYLGPCLSPPRRATVRSFSCCPAWRILCTAKADCGRHAILPQSSQTLKSKFAKLSELEQRIKLALPISCTCTIQFPGAEEAVSTSWCQVL
uniref:Putative secreted protein n=1 Tax=Anopheles marajoara TaxID=58244 RepID=A0A2M4C7W3_9DIPT